MGRSQESFNKKEVRNKKEKKRKDKEAKRQARKENEKKGGLDDMIAYVDENGMLCDTPPDPTKKKEEIKAEDIDINVPRRDSSEEEETERTGTVNFYNSDKGFGFIKDNQTGKDIFVHAKSLLEDIKEGNLVTYEVIKGPKGLAAEQVKVVR